MKRLAILMLLTLGATPPPDAVRTIPPMAFKTLETWGPNATGEEPPGDWCRPSIGVIISESVKQTESGLKWTCLYSFEEGDSGAE